MSPSARRRHAHTELRKELYAAIRHALDRSTVRFPRPVVVLALATMATEQAALLAQDAERKPGGEHP